MVTSFILRPKWYLKVGGVARDCGDVTLNFSLGEALTTVADIEILSVGITSPAVGTAIELSYVDLDRSLMWTVFKGTVVQPMGISYPNKVSVRCNGPLAKLRDTWDADTDFTGSTDGEVVEAALTASGITYTPAFIQDAGLVLGAQQAVIAPKRQKRATIVSEIDRLLFMNLIEIGGEIFRFYINQIPDAGDIYRTYTRGVDCDFWSNERWRGPIDDIINDWRITGVTYDCGDCRCSVWAEAHGSHPALGSGVRVEPGTESSELIQDDDFAEWIATEYMRIRARVPDRVTMTAPYDPAICVGTVIGLRDEMRGLDITGSATGNPYLIERIDVTNYTMTLQLRGPSVGYSYTSSSGIDKQCNDSTTPTTPLTPGFGAPGIVLPPLITPDPWSVITAPDAPTGCSITTLTDGDTAVAGKEWRISGTVTINPSSEAIKIGVTSDDGEFSIKLGGSAYYALTGDGGVSQLWELECPGEYQHVVGSNPTTPISFIIQFSGGVFYFFVQYDINHRYLRQIILPHVTMANAVTFIDVLAGSPTLADEELYVCGDVDGGSGTADDLLAPAWVPIWVTNDNDVWGPTPDAGSWAFNGLTGVATVNALSGPFTGWGTQATLRTGVPASSDKWTLVAQGSYTGAIQSFFLQAIDNTGGTLFIQNVSLEYADGADRITEFITTDDIDDPGFTMGGGEFKLSIIKDGNQFTARIEEPPGVELYNHTMSAATWAADASADDIEILVVAWTNGAGGVLTLTALGMNVGTADQDWVSDFGSWTISGADLTETSGFGHAHYIGPSADPGTGNINTWNQIVLEADVDLPAVADNKEFCAFLLEDATSNLATVEVWGPSTTDPGPGIWMYTFSGLGYVDHNTGLAAATPFHIKITWDKAIGTMTAVFTGNISGTITGSLGSPSGAVTLTIANENNGGGTGVFTNVVVTVT